MRPINRKCVILSAERSILDHKDNKQRMKTLRGYLKKNKFSHKDLIGHYNGNTEDSVLIELDDRFTLKDAIDITQWYEQESILYLDEDRNALLVYSDDIDNVVLGKFRDITPKQAQKLDAWSYCPLNDQYYGVL